MSQKCSAPAAVVAGPAKQPAERVVRDIRRRTRKQHSAEEKIRIVLEGRKRGVEALLPARAMTVLGELGARELRATLWIALTTTRRAVVTVVSRF